ncbi:isocitrate/isopropylmalate dehydrogenase family protein [Paenibacillus sp. GP183]|uniref:isocitrate/isopropylmalate dehydrogenase family protein n=1 Tax=Paenibacillus sp. GP183 TaxID=1882751 RepID=UPI00089D61C3|nr:isocitrate/isopropylmalate dehydrogenase family protein [Paenibacillus sp. GP183]SEC00767.1 3-isopropylmalate dehydrogenase [Paenibacillus sp. GP183]
MGNYKIAVMEGDGIGPEIVRETIKVLNAVHSIVEGLHLEFRYFPVGLAGYESKGSTLPNETIEGLKNCHAGILGPVTTHIYETTDPNMINPSGALRKKFDLYANIRPAKNYVGVNTRYENVDLVIVRENTEGMYSDRNLYFGSGEFMPDPDTVLSLRVVTRKASERLAKVGFELANTRRKSVTLVHKMNVLRKGCGLFYDSCKSVGSEYKDVSIRDYHVDAFALYLVQKPEVFDVVVTTNMFGDILSDQAAGLVGGLGLAPGLNLGDHFMIAQATHGSAPDIAGKNIANPVAEILSAKMMLEWLGIRNNDQSALDAALLIQKAVEEAFKQNLKTPDLGGSLSTDQYGDSLVKELEKLVLQKQ